MVIYANDAGLSEHSYKKNYFKHSFTIYFFMTC